MRLMTENKHHDFSVMEVNDVGIADGYLYFSIEYLEINFTHAYERADYRWKTPCEEVGYAILMKLLNDGYAKLDGMVEIYDTKKKAYREC